MLFFFREFFEVVVFFLVSLMLEYEMFEGGKYEIFKTLFF